MARTTPAAPDADAAPADDAAEDTKTVFESDYPALIVYHEGHLVATFEQGRFATSDEAVIAALALVPSVRVAA